MSLAKILFENALIFKREQVYTECRYIIKAQAERIDGDAARTDWDEVTTAITASVRVSLEQES